MHRTRRRRVFAFSRVVFDVGGVRLCRVALPARAGWLALAAIALGVATPSGAGFAAAAEPAAAWTGTPRVWPETVLLKHPRDTHGLLATGVSAAGHSLDLTAEAKFASSRPDVITIDAAGVARPVASGEAEITVVIGAHTIKVAARVELPPEAPPVSFRHEVMPVLSKGGCNMGACHGYSLGKNGFKLSLRGPDPEQDYPAITKEFLGRRVDLERPEDSLILTKPLGQTPHQGGARLARGSLEHGILLNWLTQGAPDDLADAARVERVRVHPEKLMLAPGQKHQARLIAEYNNGATRDVTELAVFSANNEMYAQVGDRGLVTAGEPGETAVIARYERKFAAVTVVVLRDAPGFEPTPLPPAERFIDRAVIEKLNDLKVKPSELAGDDEFLRRAHLDLIGLAPTPDEIRAFRANPAPDKRAQAVDALTRRPEFVDHWSLKWGDLFQNSRNHTSQPAVYALREWIRSAVAANMPADEFARQLLTARGGVSDDPASVYLAISKDTNDTVERVTQVFCGVRMLCARCHAHPLENWTQADYYGLASFFNQLSAKADPRFASAPNTKALVVNFSTGHAGNPRSGKPQPPRFLGGVEPELAANVDRREAYARWLTAPDNPFFARGYVNRVWSYFFHRGVIDPVDDIRSTNPPINPRLLEALTADFVAHKFDTRRLTRQIVLSDAYQRSSVANDSNRFDEQNFARFVPRRVPAEALLDTLAQATGVPESFSGVPGGFSAKQLPDGESSNDFLDLFGKPQRMEACECERDNGSNMLQALHFINGKAILARLANNSSRPARLARQKLSDEELAVELYLWALCRDPRPEEKRLAVEFLQSGGENKAEALQDLFWALLNSREFLLVH